MKNLKMFMEKTLKSMKTKKIKNFLKCIIYIMRFTVLSFLKVTVGG